jgi:hypothetical protein
MKPGSSGIGKGQRIKFHIQTMENEITIRIREMQQGLVEKNLICASFKTIARISIKESLLALKL